MSQAQPDALGQIGAIAADPNHQRYNEILKTMMNGKLRQKRDELAAKIDKHFPDAPNDKAKAIARAKMVESEDYWCKACLLPGHMKEACWLPGQFWRICKDAGITTEYAIYKANITAEEMDRQHDLKINALKAVHDAKKAGMISATKARRDIQ